MHLGEIIENLNIECALTSSSIISGLFSADILNRFIIKHVGLDPERTYFYYELNRGRKVIRMKYVLECDDNFQCIEEMCTLPDDTENIVSVSAGEISNNYCNHFYSGILLSILKKIQKKESEFYKKRGLNHERRK